MPQSLNPFGTGSYFPSHANEHHRPTAVNTNYLHRFFPNARQENLFIGMIHAFIYMGIPENVLTDNMKSVVIGRDVEGNPLWQKDYETFMKTIGFHTKLCKCRHPFTK